MALQISFFQPLYGQNARFATGLTNSHFHAARRSLVVLLPIQRGNSTIKYCDASAAGVYLLIGFAGVAWETDDSICQNV